MQVYSLRIENLEDLRNYVYETLCKHEHLEPGVFPMTERFLIRSGESCGIYFCLHGPRAVRYTAIWETDRNSLLFYGATGERFSRIELAEAPSLAATAA